ncbi:MAG TPA: hypothetical protein DCS39_06615 [Rhodobiaceae bacterium]|nr:hypothetical protein [Rhodobiaceae bacterium]|tara:strand:- start:1775 stop:2119 length:345 start_codon:yes stop_codon:yes gene_type:complete
MKTNTNILTLAALILTAISPAKASSLQSALCSPDKLVLSFSAPLSDGDITSVGIGETADAKLKYELDLLPGAILGSLLTLTPDTEAQMDIRKVSPFKAYIFVTGSASGTVKCND